MLQFLPGWSLLATLDLYISESHTYKQNPNKMYFSSMSSQLEAARFASRLYSFKMLYGVKPYYTEYLLGIASLFRVLLGIGILLGLVQVWIRWFESVEKGKFFTKIFCQIMLTEVLNTFKNFICWCKRWCKTIRNKRTGRLDESLLGS